MSDEIISDIKENLGSVSDFENVDIQEILERYNELEKQKEKYQNRKDETAADIQALTVQRAAIETMMHELNAKLDVSLDSELGAQIIKIQDKMNKLLVRRENYDHYLKSKMSSHCDISILLLCVLVFFALAFQIFNFFPEVIANNGILLAALCAGGGAAGFGVGKTIIEFKNSFIDKWDEKKIEKFNRKLLNLRVCLNKRFGREEIHKSQLLELMKENQELQKRFVDIDDSINILEQWSEKFNSYIDEIQTEIDNLMFGLSIGEESLLECDQDLEIATEDVYVKKLRERSNNGVLYGIPNSGN